MRGKRWNKKKKNATRCLFCAKEGVQMTLLHSDIDEALLKQVRLNVVARRDGIVRSGG